MAMKRLETLARLLAAPLAFVMLTGLYHRGVQFTVEFPDGWSAPTSLDNNIVEIKNEAAGVICNAQSNFMATLKGSRLEDLNQRYNLVFKAADWANLLSIPENEVSVRKGERRAFGDAFFQIATLDVKAGTFVPSDTVIRFGVYILPDRVTMAGCYASAASYSAWEAIFDKTVSSLRPW